MKAQGYDPLSYYHNNAELKTVIDQIASGFFSPQEPELFKPIIDSLLYKDEYMLLADYQFYVDCQKKVSVAYQDQTQWTRMSILNVARMGKFSSDHTISEYCKSIWHVEPVPVSLEDCELPTPKLQPILVDQV